MTPGFLASRLYFSSQFTLPLSRMTVLTLSPISLAFFFFFIRWLCLWSSVRTELPHPSIPTSTQLPVSVPTDLLSHLLQMKPTSWAPTQGQSTHACLGFHLHPLTATQGLCSCITLETEVFFWFLHDLHYSLSGRLKSFPEDSLFGCRKAVLHAKSMQPRLTLCDPMDYSPPGSSVYGILQAGILEWVAMPSYKGSSLPRDWTTSLVLLYWQADSLLSAPSGMPLTPTHRPILIHTHIYIMKHYCHKKKGSPAICKNVNEPWGHYAKRNKSDKERQVLYDLSYMWNLKKPNS